MHVRLTSGCPSVQSYALDVRFIVSRISQRPDIKGKWFKVHKTHKETIYHVGFGTNGPHVK